MTRTTQGSAWNEAQRRSDIETADWFILAASHRLQQTSGEMTFLSYAINQFVDSFALQLAMLQQHVRATSTRRRREMPDHEALVERIQIMRTLNRVLDRASRRLEEQAQIMEQLAASAVRPADREQQEPQDC